MNQLIGIMLVLFVPLAVLFWRSSVPKMAKLSYYGAFQTVVLEPDFPQ